jgi:hypothetical protein
MTSEVRLPVIAREFRRATVPGKNPASEIVKNASPCFVDEIVDHLDRVPSAR